MKHTLADLRLLTVLARLLHQADPVPPGVLADAMAAGLCLTTREPRLADRAMDIAWLLPFSPTPE